MADKKFSFTATLSNGDVLTRKSFNPYECAWAVFVDETLYETGFSRTRSNAEKSAQASLNMIVGRRDYNEICNPRGSRPSSWHKWANECIKDMEGKEEWNKRISEREAMARIEIVNCKEI